MTTNAGGTTKWREVIPAGEDAKLRAFGEELRAAQRERIAKSGKKRRALHAKQHVGAEEQLVVASEVPADLRHAPFAEPGKTWRGYIRFSNGSPVRQPDKAPDARGVALKFVGVPGKKIIPGLESATTQDFLFFQNAALPTKNPD